MARVYCHVTMLTVIVAFLLHLELVTADPPPLPHAGSGSGHMKEAPHWLHTHQNPLGPALYFPLVKGNAHKSLSDSPSLSPPLQKRSLLASSDVEATFILKDETNPRAYYTTISMGADKQLFNVQVATGSSLLWIQCNCVECEGNVTNTKLPLHAYYNTSASGIAPAPSCTDPLCQELKAANRTSYGCLLGIIGNLDVTTVGTCEYRITYSDNSTSFGNVRQDTLAVMLSNGTFWEPSIYFGCGRNQSASIFGDTYGLDGVMGLAMSPDTMTAFLGSIGKSFSICLESEGTYGHLVLGRTTLPQGAVYSPVDTTDGMYFWSLTWMGYSVGEKDTVVFPLRLPVILESGSSITSLPESCYNDIYARVSIFFGTYKGEVAIDIFSIMPSLRLSFLKESGSGSVIMEIPPFNLVEMTYNSKKNTTTIRPTAAVSNDFVAIGAPWLRNFEILHEKVSDTSARIGWISINCTTGRILYPNGTNGGVVTNYIDPSPFPPNSPRPPHPPPRPPPSLSRVKPSSSANRKSSFGTWNWFPFSLFMASIVVQFTFTVFFH